MLERMLSPVMNNTKWNELRLKMGELTPPLAWITRAISGYEYGPDSDWEYHFRLGGYEDILHLDIQIESNIQREHVRSILQKIHVAGEETKEGFRVFGYIQVGQIANNI